MNVGDTLSNPTVSAPATSVDGDSVNLKNTFDDLKAGLGMAAGMDVDVKFCMLPNLNDNILQVNVYLSLSADVVLSTPNLNSLPAGTKDALELGGVTAAGSFVGDAVFYVNASMTVHLGLPETGDGRRGRVRRSNSSVDVPPNGTMLDISAGFRANAHCDLQVLRTGLNFLNGSVSLTDVGFDVIFPYGGHGKLSDVLGSLASTTISRPTGNFSAVLEFDANKALQIEALADLDLKLPKFLLSLDDGNVFSNELPEEQMTTTIDFDVSEFKEYIITAMAKIAGMEFGFDIAGAQPTIPVNSGPFAGLVSQTPNNSDCHC